MIHLWIDTRIPFIYLFITFTPVDTCHYKREKNGNSYHENTLLENKDDNEKDIVRTCIGMLKDEENYHSSQNIYSFIVCFK